MKKIIFLLLMGTMVISLFYSCGDMEDLMGGYLDKPPGVDVTVDTIFSSKVQAETFVASTYRYGVHSIFPRNDATYTGKSFSVSGIGADESEAYNSWVYQQLLNSASITVDNITKLDCRFYIRFKAIRYANILMERIGKVPEVDESYVTQVIGEAKFIRALNYFEMLKRYGGVPIITESFELDDDFFLPRNSIEEVVDFIIADCNDAISSLPDSYSSDMYGRATKGAALMLKARTLLYAASPQFNTSTPYLSMDDPSKNNMICYGNYDVNRWELAADAAKVVIDWASSGGISLVTDQGIDENYRYACSIAGNSEIIFANQCTGTKNRWSFPWTSMLPCTFLSGTWQMGYSMTFNFLQKYEKQDGTSQTWNLEGGDDLTQKYYELDHRFMQSVAVVGSYWNTSVPLVNSQVGGSHNRGCYGGQWVTKMIPRSLSAAVYTVMPNDIIFRLAEAYLDYAEALNEFSGPVAEAYEAVNIIRRRSGQPDLPAGLSQDQFRERIRNERAIELFDEDHRLWDIRRWLIAEEDGVMQGNFYGIKAYDNPAAPNFRYEVYQFEIRSFTTKMYLYPFVRSEVLKGYLDQNPGW